MIADKELDQRLRQKLRELEELIDRIGPTPLRHELGLHRADMYCALRDFDQDAYEGKA